MAGLTSVLLGHNMDSDKKAEFINRVIQQTEKRQGKITLYHALNSSFQLREVFRLSEETAPYANRFLHANVIPWYLKKKGAKKIINKEVEFQILMAHLAFAYSTRPLRLSLSRNSYTNFRRLSPFIIDLVNFLEENHYIQILRGVNLGHIRYWSRICPTLKLWRELLSKLVVTNNPENKPGGGLVVLKGKRKNPVTGDYNEINCPEGKYPRLLRERIKKINTCNSRHRIAVNYSGHEELVIPCLHAVYNRSSFDCGGRLYNGIFGYQFLPKKVRRYLQIDGHNTVELDFSAFHPRLLYALEGIDYQKDPYTVVTTNLYLRAILKKMLLAIINSVDQLEAVRAGNYSLIKEPKLRSHLKKNGYTVKQLVDLFTKAHAPISHYFFNNQGLHLMRLDSEIAINVLEHFTDKGDACLSIHDSFRVRVELEEELREVMQLYYGKITQKYSPDHRVYRCKIDRK